MSADILQLEKFINGAVAQLVLDGNEKALQKLSVIADGEASGHPLDTFESKGMELLMQIAANQAALKAAAGGCRIDLQRVQESLSWNGTLGPGESKIVSLSPKMHVYVAPRYWLVSGPRTVVIESVIHASVSIIAGPLSMIMFRDGHLVVDWPVLSATKPQGLQIVLANIGEEPAAIKMELLCEGPPNAEQPFYNTAGTGFSFPGNPPYNSRP